MNILFTICGRAGSKGFKNKNLKKFLDVPLVYYSIAIINLFIESEVGKENHVDVVVNTDSMDLIKQVENQKHINAFYIVRCKELSEDNVPKVAVIKDCLNQMENKQGITYDMVVDLDITSPLRTLNDVINAINKKCERAETDVVFSVVPSRRNPYFNMVREENGFFGKAILNEYTARQQAPILYDMNASIYVYSSKTLKTKDEKTFFNSRCDVIIMKDTGILDIDSEEDYELLQVIAKHFFQTDAEYLNNYNKAKEINNSVELDR